MSRRVVIRSAILARRPQDVEAALGATAVRPRDGADLVAVWQERRLLPATRLAGRLGAELVRFSPAALGFARLDEAGRPLGYRIEPAGILGGASEPDPARASALAERLAALAVLPAVKLLGSGIALPRAGAGADLSEATAELITRTVFLDPYDRGVISPEQAVDAAFELVRLFTRDERPATGLNITVGKRRHVRAFLDSPAGPVRHFTRLPAALRDAVQRGSRIVVWASRHNPRVETACAARGIPLARMEDGFLRSVGLGAAFVKSLSLVVDEGGIYYDPSRPSDLELILQNAEIGPELVARAARLRAAIVAANLTKYNVGRATDERIVPAGATGVLVPGQVEDDASILRGASAVRTNLGLIQAARARWPDAFLIYKPHPDVEAGYRVGKVEDAEALRYADAVVRDRAITALFAECAAIETMTSLAGFEGLLRGLKVAAHGQPFYAGWGLTDDLAPLARRTRRRSLDELVAATLILYPRYVDPVSRLPCGPEIVLQRLQAEVALARSRPGALRGGFRHTVALARHRVLGPLLKKLP